MQLFNSLMMMLAAMAPYILLGFLIAGLMHAFISQRSIARHLAAPGLKSVVKAALFGIPLPLCSCGVLPTAIAMRRSGASRAASTSFLLATPQTGVDSIAATWSLLGPAFAVVRPVAALLTALFGGLAVGRGERHESAHDHAHCSDGQCDAAAHDEPDTRPVGFGRRCLAALRYGFVDLVGSIGGWLVVGLVIAAVITVYVPADAFAVLGRNPLLSMIAVLVIAIPMYVCATGSIPIAMSLMLKGLSPGTALVLLMAGPAVNFASYALVQREMGRRAALTYIGSVIVGAIFFGLAVDYLLPHSWFELPAQLTAACHGGEAEAPDIFSAGCAAVLAVLLVAALIGGHKHQHLNTTEMTKEYIIKGMNCPHCQAAVQKSIASVAGVTAVVVDLHTGRATVEGNPADDAVAAAVRAAGFDIEA